MFMAMYRCQDSAIGHFGRIMGSVADITQASTSLATTALNTTTDLASTDSFAVQAITTTSLSAAAAAWRGIDVHNLQGVHATGRVVADDGSVLQQRLVSNASFNATLCDLPEALGLWGALLSSVSEDMPLVQSSQDFFLQGSRFVEVSGKAQALWTGQVLFEFAFASVGFQSAWANPLWAALELSMQAEQPQVLELAKTFGQNLPTHNVSWGGAIHSQGIASEVLLQGQHRLGWRKWRFRMAYLTSVVSSGVLGLTGAALFFAILPFRRPVSFCCRDGWNGMYSKFGSGLQYERQ